MVLDHYRLKTPLSGSASPWLPGDQGEAAMPRNIQVPTDAQEDDQHPLSSISAKSNFASWTDITLSGTRKILTT